MWSAILVFLQIIKVFLDLWKATKEEDKTKQATKAKEIVDAVASTDPSDKASKLNAIVNDIRLRN